MEELRRQGSYPEFLVLKHSKNLNMVVPRCFILLHHAILQTNYREYHFSIAGLAMQYRDYFYSHNNYGFIGSVETGMNLGCSLPNHENRNVYDGTPPQGLSEARRARFF